MDDNLKLKLIELTHSNEIESFNRKKFLQKAGWSDEKISDYEGPSTEIRTHFLSMKLSVLNQLTGLYVSTVDNYKWKIFPSWNGEDAYFAINSLEEICTICPNIKIISIDHLNTDNLAPLLELTELEEIDFDYCEKPINPEIFRQFKNLKKLTIGCPYLNKDIWDSLEQDLTDKGVELDLSLWID